MLDLSSSLFSFAAMLGIAVSGWVVSVAKRDVSIVDVLWGLMILAAAAVYAMSLEVTGSRTSIVLVLATLWALRLSGYIGWRNHGQAEDRRYQEIRKRNEPNFDFKSLYLVFLLQACLGLIVALPLLTSIGSPRPLALLDYAGVALWIVGLAYETIADWQLAQFKSNDRNRGQVLAQGLWRYSRHPNYFGEFLLWWGAYLLAASAGAWWTVISPLLMSVLLLRVSGVTLLEKDIGERRPAYRAYIQSTNTFFPGPPRREHAAREQQT
jgi:steroid 5-alpha reductase family enzyme